MKLVTHTRSRARAVVALVVTLLSSCMVSAVGTVPATLAASPDNLHNVPGVALPAADVSGTLGGPVYDDVYRVIVPAGHILLAAMTGDPGTDFDIYLFDSSATDIYAQPPQGLVAKSTGPTSTEAITYPSIGGGTYYIDLSGYSTIEGNFHLAVRILADTKPPQVSVSIDGGAPATNNPAVGVTVIATDDLSGIATMTFSLDDRSWSDPAPYQPTVSLNLDGPDGPRTLWVRVSDRAGNVSPPASASIVLDRVPPTVIARTPEPGGNASGLQPTISVRFSEPIQRSTWTSSGLILQDGQGTVVYGTYGYDPTTFTGSFTPAVSLQPGVPYVVSLGTVTDLAGNEVARPGSWTITPLLAPTITIRSDTRVATRGAIVEITGRMAPILGGSLVLEQAVGNGAFLPILPLAVDASGAFSWPAPVGANTSFRAHYSGSMTAAETFSPVARVLVRRSVAVLGLDAATTRRVPAFRRISLVAMVSPADPPVPVTLSIFRYVSGHGYVRQAAVTRTTVTGRYTFSWTPGRGSYYIRLTTPSTPAFANGVSGAYRWVGY